VPLSEDEQRILLEMERALEEHDPAFADRVRSETVYRHAGRYCKWAALGFVAGLALLLVSFSTSLVGGFAGFLVMLFSVIVFERNLRRMGRAGWHDVSRSMRARGLSGPLGDTRRRLRERFKRSD
jgi:fatty acid desaturase